MAKESPPPFPLSYLGPCKLSWFHPSADLSFRNPWVFWSRYNDELRQYHHRPLLLASNNGDTFIATAATIKEKIKCAVQGIDPQFFGYDCLVQFWGLVNIGDSGYLTTCDQPFALTHWLLANEEEDVEGLCQYRKHCLEYLIAVDETTVQEGELGPPGRVFRSGLPEFIIDVRHYSSKEFPQRDFAVKYVKCYWALPVYQLPGRNCIGVLEFVSPKYDPFILWGWFLDLLKEVGLTTICPIWLSNYEQSSSCHKQEIDKIAHILKAICKTHQIPAAQMWIEANSKEHLKATYQGSYFGQFDSWFMDAYRLCFIRKGHGVIGKAFSSKSACFCRDIRQLSISEYPFVPNARQFGFSSCFAICLQSSCLNSCIYTLEFLLPTNEINAEDPRTLLLVIMETLKQSLQSSFKLASGQELGQNLFVEVINVSSNDKLDSFEIGHAISGESTPRVVEVQNQVGMTPRDGSIQQVYAANNFVHDINAQYIIVRPASTPELVQNVVSRTHQQPIEELDAAIPVRDDASMEHNGNDAAIPVRDDASMEHNGNEATNLRKSGSAYTLESELGITRDVLEQYSAMKLVDVAKYLGVSRSTFKRTCRRYGIQRWPPHKGKKYNRTFDQQEFVHPSKKNIGAQPMSGATRLLGDSSIMAKATYGDDMIKFQLLLSATKMELQENVAKRLNLPVGSFRIKFLDEDNEWILVTCDEDLSISLRMLRSLGKSTVRMSVSQ